MPPIPPWAAALRRPIALPVVLLLAVAIMALAPQGASRADTPRHPATQRGPSVNLVDYGAVCDGVTNDGPAFAAALSDLTSHGGGTLELPAATCLVKTNSMARTLPITSDITVQGQGATSKIAYSCIDPSAYGELFGIGGHDIALRDFQVLRVKNCYTVSMVLHATTGFTMDHVLIEGHGRQFDQTMHGVMLQGTDGPSQNLVFDSVTMRHLDYGMFQPSGITAPVTGVTVRNSHFFGNRADDLEFNAPTTAMHDVKIVDCTFRANRAVTEAAGFGVGLANVTHAVVQGNLFVRYRFEPVHIEDRSRDIQVLGNTFRRSFTANLPWASHVFVVNDSHDVTVRGNTFDARGNAHPFQAVLANAGGVNLPSPTDVIVEGNRLVGRGNATIASTDGIAGAVVRNNQVTVLH